MAAVTRNKPFRVSQPRHLNDLTIKSNINTSPDSISNQYLSLSDVEENVQKNVEMSKMSSNMLILTEVKRDILKMFESLESLITGNCFDNSAVRIIEEISVMLKQYGIRLDKESNIKDQLDIYFSLLRNVLRRNDVNALSRARILQLIEMRAAVWDMSPDINDYYDAKIIEFQRNDTSNNLLIDINALNAPQSPSFSGNDVSKNSGKVMRPAKVPGKPYLKDEVIIRNCDSGKVNTGAKERHVQITGQSEDNITRAKELIETTIKRNASPIPFEHTSGNVSFDMTNQNTNDNYSYDLSMIENDPQSQAFVGSANDCVTSDSKNPLPYSYSLKFGTMDLVISCNNAMAGREAKMILENYFNGRSNEPTNRIVGYEPSDSSDSTEDVSKKSFNQNVPKVRDGFDLKRQHSAANVMDTNLNNSGFGNNLQRSASHGNVPFGRTSLRYLNMSHVPEHRILSYNSANIIAYDRDFLIRCGESPLCRVPPPKIGDRFSDIIRKA